MRLTILLLLLAASSAFGQTVKTLGYNTNGQVVANTGTNVLTFTNSIVALFGNLKMIDGTSIDVADGDFGILAGNIFLGGPLEFNSTNAAADAALTRTNLGLHSTNGSGAVFAASVLWDSVDGGQFGLSVNDSDLTISSGMAKTNAPADTTNAARWINVLVGTNSYRVPLYQ